MNTLFIFGAKYAYIICALLFIGFFFTRARRDQKQLFILSIIYFPLTLALARLTSHFYYDPRPFVSDHITPLITHVADNGFPSDHALLTTAFAAVITIYHKKIGLVAWLLAIYVAVSRVMVGVHHVSDVLGSAVVSLLTLALVYGVIMPYIMRSSWCRRYFSDTKTVGQ